MMYMVEDDLISKTDPVYEFEFFIEYGYFSFSTVLSCGFFSADWVWEPLKCSGHTLIIYVDLKGCLVHVSLSPRNSSIPLSRL